MVLLLAIVVPMYTLKLTPVGYRVTSHKPNLTQLHLIFSVTRPLTIPPPPNQSWDPELDRGMPSGLWAARPIISWPHSR